MGCIKCREQLKQRLARTTYPEKQTSFDRVGSPYIESTPWSQLAMFHANWIHYRCACVYIQSHISEARIHGSPAWLQKYLLFVLKF